MTQEERIKHIKGLNSKEKLEDYLRNVHINISLETYEKLELIELCEREMGKFIEVSRTVVSSDNSDILQDG